MSTPIDLMIGDRQKLIERICTNVPRELRDRAQWVCWRFEQRGGKPTKVPICARGGRADSSRSDTWATFKQAVSSYLGDRALAGVGFVFSHDDPFCGIDLDNCLNDSGTIKPWALEIVQSFASYTEVSPSGLGVKLFCRARKPGKRCRTAYEDGEIEIYDSGRFFTVTGERWLDSPTICNDAQAALDALYERLFPERQPAAPGGNGRMDDQHVIELALRDAKFERLWHGKWESTYVSHSEADEALCCKLAFFTRDPAQIDRLFRRSGLMRPKWDDRRGDSTYGQQTIQQALELVDQQYTPRRTRRGRRPKPAHTDIVGNQIDHTDLGNARRLIDLHGDRLRYVGPWDKWLVWDGRRWKLDDMCAVERLAKDVARQRFAEIGNRLAEDSRANVCDDLRFAKYSAKATGISAMLTLARSEVAISHTELDRNPWLLNVENGTLDLRTGQLRPHDRADLLTKLAPVVFDPDAQAPRWERFVAEIMDYRSELIEYLQRLVGYCLTGVVREHVLPILWGVGANGKSTLIGTILALLGNDYGCKTPQDFLLQKRHETHPTALTDLFGRRLVAAVETESGRRLAESLVKELTGGDPIRARRMREDFWQFEPTHKVWLVTNHKPVIRGTDDGIWRRVKLIPFDVRIPDDQQDTELPDKLRQELPGILNWALAGCRAWQQRGLGEPHEVRAATDRYRNEMDMVGQFLAEATVDDPTETTPLDLVHKAYANWGGKMGPRALSKALVARGYQRTQITSGSYKGRIGFVGLRLTSIWESTRRDSRDDSG